MITLGDVDPRRGQRRGIGQVQGGAIQASGIRAGTRGRPSRAPLPLPSWRRETSVSAPAGQPRGKARRQLWKTARADAGAGPVQAVPSHISGRSRRGRKRGACPPGIAACGNGWRASKDAMRLTPTPRPRWRNPRPGSTTTVVLNSGILRERSTTCCRGRRRRLTVTLVAGRRATTDLPGRASRVRDARRAVAVAVSGRRGGMLMPADLQQIVGARLEQGRGDLAAPLDVLSARIGLPAAPRRWTGSPGPR